jgi:hypothetical protein
MMKTIVLLFAIAITTQALGAERGYKDWTNPNKNESFHIDNQGTTKQPSPDIDPLVNRAYELMDGNHCDKGRCPELHDITWKLQTFWLNATYDNRKRIDSVRIATEKCCGKL